MNKKSELWIETGKGRLYIQGDNSMEIIVPPGLTIGIDLAPLPGQELPNIPPINTEGMSDEDMDAIIESVKNLRIRRAFGPV